METQPDEQQRKQKVAAILNSQLDPLTKVRHIVVLGYEEEEADTMVANNQIGPGQPVYYEQLPAALYADDRL